MDKYKRICVLLLVLLTLCACSKKAEQVPDIERVTNGIESNWQEQYDLGIRYLLEGNYQEAILAFEAAIEIDPKQETVYIKYAEAYERQENYAAALQVLQRGINETESSELLQEVNRIKQEILQNNPAVVNLLPAVGDDTGYSSDVAEERLYRSVILNHTDGSPVQFALVQERNSWEVWLHRYTVSKDASINDEKLISMFDEGGRTDIIVYYDTRLDCFCLANAATYYGTPTGAWGCKVKIYMLKDAAQLYREWEWVNLIDSLGPKSYEQCIDEMKQAGLPYFPDYFDDNYSIVLCPEMLGNCYWLYKHDSFNVFPSDNREQDGYMVEWNIDELSRFELQMQAQSGVGGAPETEKVEQGNDAATTELLKYIAALPKETVADSALKIVDAYVDMLNSYDSGEGVFFPDETNTEQFWTSIFFFEINERTYFDENRSFIDAMIRDGHLLIDSRQNVQDIANAMYGKVVDLPPVNSGSVFQFDGDPNYYFGFGDRGRVQVILNSFEQLDDGSAELCLSYALYGTGQTYLTAQAKLRVNPNVNYGGEIPFYYMIESVEIRHR